VPTRLGPRFAIEAVFLVLVAVAVGLADLSTEGIVIVMAGAWLLAAAVEWAASTRERWTSPIRRGARWPVQSAAPVVMEPPPGPQMPAAEAAPARDSWEETVVPPPPAPPPVETPPPETPVAEAPVEERAPVAEAPVEEKAPDERARIEEEPVASLTETAPRQTRYRLEPLQALPPRRRFWQRQRKEESPPAVEAEAPAAAEPAASEPEPVEPAAAEPAAAPEPTVERPTMEPVPTSEPEPTAAPEPGPTATVERPTMEAVPTSEPEPAPEERPEPVVEKEPPKAEALEEEKAPDEVPPKEPEQPVQAAPPPPPPAEPQETVRRIPQAPKEWNIWDLERLVREQRGTNPERAEEWSLLLLHLRNYANAEGTIPVEFDPLVRESFGELVESASSP
jgi:hypothetical protein